MPRVKHGYERLCSNFGPSLVPNEMWEHQSSVLHKMQLESSRVMQEANINDANHKAICKDWYLPSRRPVVLWCSTGDTAMQATQVEVMMACECKDFGQQVGAMSLDWSDDDEPVLPSSPIHKDSYECISGWADWICSTLHSDEPIDFVAFPYNRTWLKNLKLLALIWY